MPGSEAVAVQRVHRLFFERGVGCAQLGEGVALAPFRFRSPRVQQLTIAVDNGVTSAVVRVRFDYLPRG